MKKEYEWNSYLHNPLGRDNYDTWKIHIEALLVKNDTWDYVSGISVRLTEAEAARAWDRTDDKAKSEIILTIRPSELKQIKGCSTSRDVWKKLQSIYESKGPARKASLLKQLILRRMRPDQNVRDHINTFFDILDKLAEIAVEINEDLLTILLLYNLPEEYENFRVAIESRLFFFFDFLTPLCGTWVWPLSA